jgi:hypothetical protein
VMFASQHAEWAYFQNEKTRARRKKARRDAPGLNCNRTRLILSL